MEEIIQQIADLLETEEIVFMHRESHEILSYPKDTGNEYDYLMQEVLDIVDLNPEQYLRFDPLDSNEGYRMREQFALMVDDLPSKSKLVNALQSKKPFRQFRMVVEEEQLFDPWINFKMSWLEMVVRDKLPD